MYCKSKFHKTIAQIWVLFDTSVVAMVGPPIEPALVVPQHLQPGSLGGFPNSTCLGPVHSVTHFVKPPTSGTCYEWKSTLGINWIGMNFGSGDEAWDNYEILFYPDTHCNSDNVSVFG